MGCSLRELQSANGPPGLSLREARGPGGQVRQLLVTQLQSTRLKLLSWPTQRPEAGLPGTLGQFQTRECSPAPQTDDRRERLTCG